MERAWIARRRAPPIDSCDRGDDAGGLARFDRCETNPPHACIAQRSASAPEGGEPHGDCRPHPRWTERRRRSQAPIRRASAASQAARRAPHRCGASRARQGRARDRAARRPRRLGAGDRSAGPGRAARGAGRVPRARARPAQVWADAGVAVHVLPRCRVPDGGRPRRCASDRAGCAALRRCAPVQLRRVRRSRSATRVQHQRLRRDVARALRMGRQAARGQLGRGRPRSRLRREAASGRSTRR